jgi:muramoyltetrapeptide carboxypeptidase
VKSGAAVGVVALAGPPDPEELAAGLTWLREHGFRAVSASNLTHRAGYLAGSDETRLAGLHELLDLGVEVLLAARGGYGTARLLPALPWERLAAWGGWLVGFSDLTALHVAMAGRFPRATLHGAVAATLALDPRSSARLAAWLRGEAPRRIFGISPRAVVRPGVARGVSVGGNLSLLASLIGTPFEADLEDAIVFLEDVGEPLYRLDRLLTQLRLSSRLAGIKALVAGRLVQCGRGERARDERWRTLLAEAVPGGTVVVAGLPFGHGKVNTPFPLGLEVEVDTVRGRITWEGA